MVYAEFTVYQATAISICRDPEVGKRMEHFIVKKIIIIKRTFSGFPYFLIRSHYPERRAGGTEVG